jgi:hypothetical protein
MVNWQELLHDKRFLGLAAAGGIAGGYVLWKRKQTTGSTIAQPQASTAAGGVGTFDSTGTDIASFLGNYSANLQQQLDDYQKQLTGALAGLGQPGVPGTPSPNPSPTPKPKPVPSPAPKPNPGGATHGNTNPGESVTVAKFTSSNPPWNSTLSGIAQHEHTTVDHLLALNPQIHNRNLIITGQQIRTG